MGEAGAAPLRYDRREMDLPADRAARYATVRAAVREVCAGYPDAYWRDLQRTQGYP
jgi:hypothetical protein